MMYLGVVPQLGCKSVQHVVPGVFQEYWSTRGADEERVVRMEDLSAREAEDGDVDYPMLTAVAKSDTAEVLAVRLSSTALNQAQAADRRLVRWTVCLPATERT